MGSHLYGGGERLVGNGPQDLGTDSRVLGEDRERGRDWAGVEWTLTIGCPQLGLQWTQDRARREVGGQVEFPVAGTVLWEWQAGSQVLYPVCVCAGRGGGSWIMSCPTDSTQAPGTPSQPLRLG